jgi:uncharacterized protein
MTGEAKPRDVGNGLVCASFGAGGAWLSLATVDPVAGFVEVSGLPEFEPGWRGDPVAVRRYRSWMRRERHAFLGVDGGNAQATTRQEARRDVRAVVQRVVLRGGPTVRPAGIAVRFAGRLGPPALAEITEVRPPDEAPALTSLTPRDGVLVVQGAGAPLLVQAWLRKGRSADAERRADVRLDWQLPRRGRAVAVAWVEWPADEEEVRLDIACSFEAPVPGLPGWLARELDPLPDPARATREKVRPLRVPARLTRPLGRMSRQAAAYVRGCTALRTSGSERVILADHRILPLSWTRDAYWQARLLLAAWAKGGHAGDARIVADHLRWLFLRCERPDGRWVRSHHADGRRKDPPFQADQQLYPLLELTDFRRATGRLPVLPPGHDWATLVTDAWAAAERAVDDRTGLIGTHENPADDPVTHPYLASDQVLLWKVATRLAEAARAMGLPRGGFAAQAARSRAALREHLVVGGPLGRQWAYAGDGQGGHELMVDANDLPLPLAPLWGFCRASDRAWRATMRFATHPANPAFVPGRLGGVGSRHTPGTWTLGDIGRWVAAGVTGDREASDAALARLVTVALDDGMLPEAYDPEGSGRAVRHWFAWPGAALGALVLEHAQADR